jgi:NlpC/P60 family
MDRVAKTLVGVGLALSVGAAGSLATIAGCSSSPRPSPNGGGGASAPNHDGPCPKTAAAPDVLPGVRPEHRSAAHWIARTPEPDAVVLSAAAIARHDAAFAARMQSAPEADPLTQEDLAAAPPKALVEHELGERLAYLAERIADGRYLDAEGRKLAPDAQAAFEAPRPLPPMLDQLVELHESTTLWCGPHAAGLFKGPDVDLAFDRNVCSTVRKGEVVRVVSRWPGMLLVRTPYAYGWIEEGSPRSAPLSAEIAAAKLQPRRRDLTRRALLDEAFRLLDTPYGWGGRAGGRDCSRFLMDVFGSFGLRLPRHSGAQAKAGSMRLDVGDVKSSDERLRLIDAAQARGVVLLHFPGHIMLYLGRNEQGRPMAIHAFAEYLEACSEAGETLRRVDRVQVSDLSLGQGTSRRSFVERLTTITVFGITPGPALLGAAERRPAAPLAKPSSCEAGDVEVLVSPRKPHPGVPLRVLVAARDDLGPVQVALWGPGGQTHRLEVTHSGGPPFGYAAELAGPAAGDWTLAVGDGDRVSACRRFEVHEEGDRLQGNNGRVWTPRHAWTQGKENLFALWVERLFDHPLDDRTWPNLQSLLGQRSHNVLHDHLGQGEDGKLALQPDCADLPYFLRAYFSWKLRLPFAYRHCNRGSKGKAPYCDRELHDNLASMEDSGTEVHAFGEFARRNVANGVHSGSGRCAPGDSENDYYPVPVTREAIKPGVIFADPYGHLFVIAKWVPQGASSHGLLIGADAQPDGTIGRRRFWPGSFLFTPDTAEAGAGFKAFRPTRFSRGRMRQVANDQIAALGLTAFSMDQYEGSKEHFYDRVEALINPRPLDPKAMLDVLMGALFEQVKRRVVSVQNAEDYKASRRGAIDMPSGHSIFETTGAWENYSTPSRDMRLLIAMDTVLGFPDAVKRSPERFGLAAGGVEAAVAELRSYLSQTLEKMPLSYRNSDGDEQALSVQDVVQRASAFEMAYNPNDCVEVRWAAPDGSAEAQRCRRRAPDHQTAKMRRYRPWFAERRRPPR